VQALKDLGALPVDADIDQVIKDLGLDKPAPDVALLSADELTAQLRDLTKQLLAYGARMPKELMLFVKDMLFLDGAVATLAPGIDLLGEVARIATYFAERHGDRIAADIGVDPRAVPVDLGGLRASIGLAPEVEEFTYRDLQERREIVRKKFERKDP
jgi:ubiquinone biosynthesis protein